MPICLGYAPKENMIIILKMYKDKIYFRAYNISANHTFDSMAFKEVRANLIPNNEFLNSIYNYFYNLIELKNIMTWL